MSRVVFRNKLDPDNPQPPVQDFYSGFTPTLYAAPADVGNGSGSSEANAMDLPTALATIAAGGILGVLPGVYSAAPSGSSQIPNFTIANGGTSAANPVRVVCKYPAVYLATPESNANRTELRSTVPATHAPLFGPAVGINHVHMYGFFLDMDQAHPAPSNGMIMLRGGDGHRVEQMVLDGMDLTGEFNDNWNHIFIQEADDVVVRNNWLRDLFWTANQNVTSITTYGAMDLLVEHNYFDECFQAVFIKGDAAGEAHKNSGIIRFNKIESTQRLGLSIDIVEVASSVEMYQNLFVNVLTTLNLDDSSDHGPRGSHFYNNTIVNAGWTSFRSQGILHTDVSFFNNIVYWPSSQGAGVNAVEWDVAPTTTLMDNNYYYENGGAVQWVRTGVEYTTIASWRTITGDEDNSSASTDPQFVNPSSNWHLQGGSSALTAGNTGGPIGCYISGAEEIGIEAQ